jgi:hypothetical protein
MIPFIGLKSIRNPKHGLDGGGWGVQSVKKILPDH